MQIIFRESCVEDLRWFRKYYSKIFPDGKANAKKHFNKAYHALAENPTIGRSVKGFEPVRELLIARSPFSFVYIIDGNRIVIMRVLDRRGNNQVS